MKIFVYCCIAMFFCLINIGQTEGRSVVKPPSSVPQKGLLAIISNDKYELDCILYGSHVVGYDVNGQIVEETHAVKDILIYERTSGRYEIYEPLHDYPGALFINETVWSPNKEYFVLVSRGSPEIQILHSSHVLEYINDIQRGDFRVFISGESINAPDLHFEHTFWKWVGDDAFLFTATHAYDHTPFIYEIGTRTLFALTEGASVFTAMIEDSKVTIQEKKEFAVLDDRDLTEVEVGMTRGIVLLRYGEPASPHDLPVWVYPSKEGYYHYVFYFWPTNDVELPDDAHDETLKLVAITKMTLEDRGYVSEEPYVKQEYYIFPEHMNGKLFTGLKHFHITRYKDVK